MDKFDKELNLSKTNYGYLKDLKYDMIILPWGATEPHNYHLPYLTDCLLSHSISLDVAKKTLETYNHRVMVLPPINMGSQNPGQYDLPFCIHTRYETQKAILTDIVASLQHQGFDKLLIINGHGGNSFKNMIRDLAIDYPNFLIASSEWFTAASSKGIFENAGDHADELETSAMLYYYPELVDMSMAGDGENKGFNIEGFNKKVAWIPRNWMKVSTDTGIGDPRKASAEKGKILIEKVIDNYANLIHEICTKEIYKD